MSRPKKKGLDYFPLDVDFLSDKKIRRLRARFGSNGVMVYIHLLCMIYRNGYYIEFDEDLILDLSDEISISENLTMQILNYLFSRSLLQLIESKLAVPVKVITASSIQRRYQEAKKGAKRDIEVEGEFWVLKKEETESFIKVRPVDGFSENNYDYSEKNGNNSEKNNTKESKEKKSKEKESKGKQNPPAPPTLDDIKRYCDERKNYVNPEKFFNYYDKYHWKTKQGDNIDWKEKIQQWETNEFAETDRIRADNLNRNQSPSPSQIVDMFHEICVSYPKLRSNSESRKKAIKARLRNYSLDDFREVFTKAENSSFLKGSNDRNWSATFDWIIKDSNFAKILDGNYDDRKERKEQHDGIDVEKYKIFINNI